MATISTGEPEVLAITGDVDMHQSPQLKQSFEPLIAKKTGCVLLDFSGVSYIDSSGLAVFIEAMQRIQSYGGKLAFFGLRDNVKDIFEFARLDQIFRIYPDKAAAVQAVQAV